MGKKTLKSLGNNIPKLFGYSVEMDHICEHSHRENGPYGSWEEQYSHSIRSVSKADQYVDVNSAHERFTHGHGYLVWIIYSTGDSFGRSRGGSTECIWLCKSLKAATKLRTAIESFDRRSDSNFIYVDKDEGIYLDIYPYWTGFFERLDEVRVEQVFVNNVDIDELTSATFTLDGSVDSIQHVVINNNQICVKFQRNGINYTKNFDVINDVIVENCDD